MQVLSKPDTSNWSTKHICNNCDSNLEINGEDLIYELESVGYYDMESDAYYVDCPVCSELSYVQENQIPKLLRIEAKNRNNKTKEDEEEIYEEVENEFVYQPTKSWFQKLIDFLDSI